MGLCRTCGCYYNGEKWYLDEELDVYRRTCCHQIVPNKDLIQKWKNEMKSIKKRYYKLKEGIEAMGEDIYAEEFEEEIDPAILLLRKYNSLT